MTQTEEVRKLQREAGEAGVTVREQKQLITHLEEDLRHVHVITALLRGDAEGEAGSADVSTELVADIVRDVMPTGGVANEGGSQSAAESLLPIVQSQRERYRIRSQQLEDRTLSQQQQMLTLQNDMDQLRSDNVKLYEKIRFLQNYPSRGSTGDDVTVSRYCSQYEERLDPFTTFSRKERQRRYAGLKPYDKITLSMGRVIMSNKTARAFAFFYTLLLHCLVFLVLYKLAYTEAIKRDIAAECHQRFSEHMMKIHGDKELHEIHAEGHGHDIGGHDIGHDLDAE
ncbi:hypothetical protein ACOMHN_058485 [Nucella lapillus]